MFEVKIHETETLQHSLDMINGLLFNFNYFSNEKCKTCTLNNMNQNLTQVSDGLFAEVDFIMLMSNLGLT